MRLFIRERDGDYNLDLKFDARFAAVYKLEEIKKNGGYWNGNVFTPWHRVDYAKVEE
jgi:hypothetical protein